MTTAIRQRRPCASCETQVIPKADGTCPACSEPWIAGFAPTKYGLASVGRKSSADSPSQPRKTKSRPKNEVSFFAVFVLVVLPAQFGLMELNEYRMSRNDVNAFSGGTRVDASIQRSETREIRKARMNNFPVSGKTPEFATWNHYHIQYNVANKSITGAVTTLANYEGVVPIIVDRDDPDRFIEETLLRSSESYSTIPKDAVYALLFGLAMAVALCVWSSY